MNLAALSILAVLTVPGAVLLRPEAAAAQSCDGLATLRFENATINAAQLITSGTFDPPGPTPPITSLPPFCRVSLTVAPSIGVEVWLPLTWNERLEAVGGGGFAGDISWADLTTALRSGYATASTDTGHDDLVMPGGSFVLNPDGTLSLQAVNDFASRSLHEMALKTRALIEAFYGHAPEYAYFSGCSTGGRQGLMAAQRFPTDYDGILAGAPAINFDRFVPAELWPQIVMNQEIGQPIAGSKLAAVTRDAIAACDDLDGVVDGVIDDPHRCHYDPAESVCQQGEDPTACLTPAEANVVRKIWEGPMTSGGQRLWFGVERGASLGLAASDPFGIAVDYYRYWINQDPAFDWHSLSEAAFAPELRLSQRKFNAVIGTDDPHLQQFGRAGGKLVIWHGQADQLIFPRGSINYYERVLTEGGGASHVEDYARLFLAPGVDHCGGGVGPNPVDPLDALIDWVENGVAPDQIAAAKMQGNQVVRTRPLCAYPKQARWTGTGSTDDASNFACVEVPLDPADITVAGPARRSTLPRLKPPLLRPSSARIAAPAGPADAARGGLGS